ncbi:hypothetical protein GCK72_010888 [Caenorhabditis remanei]|uniref:Uncharacterized protein n=1 Tax=Caenorhabditis remanei TaxID=31234 RepID=A0A6A5H6Y8_CAERE|nr:hypothetical protein GCK72_010888 [Caenorhabditis remanei]KAF1762626.1 hypothetical protein GCK72_010888 [Caenorhabditis remanei]
MATALPSASLTCCCVMLIAPSRFLIFSAIESSRCSLIQVRSDATALLTAEMCCGVTVELSVTLPADAVTAHGGRVSPCPRRDIVERSD